MLNDPVVVGGLPRDFDTDFIPSDSKTTWVTYTIDMSVVAPLLSTQDVTVDLTVASPGGDLVVLDTATLSSTQGGGLSLLSLGTRVTRTLTSFIPPNYTVRLVKSGTGTAAITASQEATF